MNESNNEETRKFSIKDRRRISEDGSLNADNEATSSHTPTTPKISVPSPSASSATPTESITKPQSSANTNIPPSEIDFSSFIVSLASQALLQMGVMDAPEGMNVEVDVSAAKHTIDILGLVQIKTKGNLDAQEAQLLESVLHDLRLAYVKVKK
jgi:hypothetical protein